MLRLNFPNTKTHLFGRPVDRVVASWMPNHHHKWSNSNILGTMMSLHALCQFDPLHRETTYLWAAVCKKHYFFYFSDCASLYNSGRWPTWHTVSSIICLCGSSTCFEQLYAHPQEDNCINPLNPELSPICSLLALLGAHHFLHISRIRVKLLTFRLLMSYIYIWSTHSWCF
jgi:hypothetical protein